MSSLRAWVLAAVAASEAGCAAQPAPTVTAHSRTTDFAIAVCPDAEPSTYQVLHSYLILDDVEEFSSDATVVLSKDGRTAGLTHRFWEHGGELRTSADFEPSSHLALQPWGTVDPSRARPELVTKMQRFFEPWGYQVEAVYVLSEGRRVRAREVLVLPGDRADINTLTFNADRDLAAVAGRATNTDSVLRSNAPLSEVTQDLAKAHRVGPLGRCALASKDRDSDAHALLAKAAVALARGESPGVAQAASVVPSACEQQLQWRVVASAPRGNGRRHYSWLTFSFSPSEVLSPDGARAEVNYTQEGHGFTATAHVKPLDPAPLACGEAPLQLRAEVSLSTARGQHLEAQVEFGGFVVRDADRVALGHFLVPRSRVQRDDNDDSRAIMWNALDGYDERGMWVHFTDRLAVGSP